jgi:hypothetical protein
MKIAQIIEFCHEREVELNDVDLFHAWIEIQIDRLRLFQKGYSLPPRENSIPYADLTLCQCNLIIELLMTIKST